MVYMYIVCLVLHLTTASEFNFTLRAHYVYMHTTQLPNDYKSRVSRLRLVMLYILHHYLISSHVNLDHDVLFVTS